MSEEVTIEVDGQSIPARKGEMLMEATDRAGIYIPRFCYHKHLSVAANCRMCLVEVERAPKPLPACATPVMDGMKVQTRSEKAIDAQRGTMEFLLINHPLDCPICDQGGECELQDLAMGYGSDVGRYTEGKRVVRDKDVGPLIKTDMTRCIHCTRCVRFGEEIAGLRELGATGRGEHMQIGTYIEKSIHSELSGNVIDLCPVGALTNRPYRYSARAWELRQGATVSPHDALGANLYVHHKGPVVKRVVPADNASVNETWIADRDRYSVHALNSDARLTVPRIKVNGAWRDASWDDALALVTDRLASVRGTADLGIITGASATSEEGLLLARLAAGLGSPHIDHRLRQVDYTDAANAPRLGSDFEALESDGAVLLVGAYPRHEMPVLNIRLRKAALKGARVMRMASVCLPVNYDLHVDLPMSPSALESALSDLVSAAESGAAPADAALAQVFEALRTAAAEGGPGARILLGEQALTGARRASLRALVARLAAAVGAAVGELPVGGNALGLHRMDVLPKEERGRNAVDMLTGEPLPVYFISDVEPEFDSLAGQRALATLGSARSVIALSAFASAGLSAVAEVMLPVAAFTETEGSRVNAAGVSQRFAPVVKAPGEARPTWKVLRRLGELLGLPGFAFVAFDELHADVEKMLSALPETGSDAAAATNSAVPAPAAGLEPVISWPMHGVDAVCRYSAPLAATQHAGDDCVHLNPTDAAAIGVADGAMVTLAAGGAGHSVEAEVRVGSYVAPGAVWMYGGRAPARGLGALTGPVELTALVAEGAHA